jgi:hypothetical protein
LHTIVVKQNNDIFALQAMPAYKKNWYHIKFFDYDWKCQLWRENNKTLIEMSHMTLYSFVVLYDHLQNDTAVFINKNRSYCFDQNQKRTFFHLKLD